ncbi:polyprenyl synthetase family protein [Candidatus Woesearchaeota archaeon]|nr:polyprenyl synthetase family protein [Candidatus Woesearchaeota archaeon]
MIINHFKSELNNLKIKIDNELNNFFSETITSETITNKDITNKNITNNKLNFNKPFLEAIKEFTLRGGKRIRPILVIKGFEAFEKNEISESMMHELIKTSICIELMQSSFLIHDDIMDEADTRRNKPTLHKLFEQQELSEQQNNDKKLSESLAILAGNIAMVLGQNIILNSNFNDEIKQKAIIKFNEIVEMTNHGQLLDLIISEKNISGVSEEEINQVMLLKTAKYTIEGPLHLGAILAGANKEQLHQLSAIALPLGIAFQIQDDILGIFADEKTLGKSIFSDIQENKKTLLMWYAYNKGNPEQKRFIKSILGKRDITSNEFEELKRIIIDIGSLEYSKNMAQSLVNDAKNNINNSSINQEAKDFLLHFAEYLIKREK